MAKFDSNRSAISEKLLAAIEYTCGGEKGNKIEELSEYLEVTSRTIHNWIETGIKKERVYINKIADFFEVSSKAFTDQSIKMEEFENLINKKKHNARDGLKLSITQPFEGQRLPHAVIMEGNIHNMPTDKEIWIVKEPFSGNYHPDMQLNLFKYSWQGTAYIGNSRINTDKSKRFIIHIVLCSLDTGGFFNDYIEQAVRTGSFTGLNSIYDGKIITSVNVIRDDSPG